MATEISPTAVSGLASAAADSGDTISISSAEDDGCSVELASTVAGLAVGVSACADSGETSVFRLSTESASGVIASSAEASGSALDVASATVSPVAAMSVGSVVWAASTEGVSVAGSADTTDSSLTTVTSAGCGSASAGCGSASAGCGSASAATDGALLCESCCLLLATVPASLSEGAALATALLASALLASALLASALLASALLASALLATAASCVVCGSLTLATRIWAFFTSQRTADAITRGSPAKRFANACSKPATAASAS